MIKSTFIDKTDKTFELVRNPYHPEYFNWEGEWIALSELEERWGLTRVLDWDEFPRYLIEGATPEEIDQLEILWEAFPEIYDPECRYQQVVMYLSNGNQEGARELEKYYVELGDQLDYAKLFWLHDLCFRGIKHPEGKWWWECE